MHKFYEEVVRLEVVAHRGKSAGVDLLRYKGGRAWIFQQILGFGDLIYSERLLTKLIPPTVSKTL